METIRCPRCQKLLRANAQRCGRCGMTMPSGRVSRRRTRYAGAEAISPSRPTSPLASPHGVGHYSGLHPEDQPFQSSFFLRVQRPPSTPSTESAVNTPLVSEVAQSFPLTGQAQLADAEEDSETAQSAAAFSALADFPTLPTRRARHAPPAETPLLEPPALSEPLLPPVHARIVRLMITGSLICFLLATGLLAFLLLSKGQGQAQVTGPRLLALPGELRVGDVLQLTGSGFEARRVVALTRDQQTPLLDTRGQQILPTTDARGTFQIAVPIDPRWEIGIHSLRAGEGHFTASTSLTVQAAISGTPSLQLGVPRIDLGDGNPGTTSQKTLALTNAGGGRVTWSARSTVPWLSLSPASGSFAGSMVVTLTVKRANLSPQAYLGQVVFTQDQGKEQTLAVAMTVNTLPANLVLSTASLAFAGTTAQSPAGQTLVIQNSGGQPLDWTAGSTTADGGNWLSMTPASGRLPARTSAVLTVNVVTEKMTRGTYQGALAFSYPGGSSQQVTITLTVSPPPQPGLQVAPQKLNFATNQGFNPSPQNFTITNSGGAPLNWALSADDAGQKYLTFSAVKGMLPPGQNTRISVAPRLGNADGTIQTTLTVVDSDAGTPVAAQQVTVSLAITDQPVITLVTGPLKFTQGSGNTESSASLTFTNSGSLPLNWTLVESTQVSWLSFDTTGDTLAAGETTTITVHCTSKQMQPGTYTVTLTIKDGDSGSIVAPQVVTVTLVVSA